MVRLGQLLEGPALRVVFERVVQLAVGQRVTRGRKMRVDTTVVETPIRYPSDSCLCENVAQGVCREIERLRSEGVTAPSGFRDVRRSVTRRVREIAHVSRRPIGREAKRRALQRPYRRLLTIVRHTIRQAIEAVRRAGRCRRPLSGRGRRSVQNLGRLARVGQKVVAQTTKRVFKGNAKSSEKLVSIFETHTKIIRRGKAAGPLSRYPGCRRCPCTRIVRAVAR
jgi:IS5 family transposase